MSNQADEQIGKKSEPDILGSRGSARALIVTQHASSSDAAVGQAAGTEALSRLRGWLEHADHTVSSTTLSQWQQAVEATRPTLILIEVGDPVESRPCPRVSLALGRAIGERTDRGREAVHGHAQPAISDRPEA